MKKILRNYLAPEAVGSIYQEVVRFLYYFRTDQSIDKFSAEYDLSRRKAKPKMDMGEGFPEAFESILGIHNAALAPQEKPLVSASTQTSLRFMDVVATTLRLFGPF